jgi:hypothetical protein
MRVGDFGVEVLPRGRGKVRETATGHVLARPGQVYALRLRNFGPLRCVADVRIDGESVTAGGLVIEAWSTEELERPISDAEDGRFTVIAEGDERVFGPDGGRDNPDLGLIEVRFRRELPRRGGEGDRPRPLPPTLFERMLGAPVVPHPNDPRFPGRFPPEWVPEVGPRAPTNEVVKTMGLHPSVTPQRPMPHESITRPTDERDIERAAGTGLTGHSEQRFRATEIGPLENEATVIQLRLVIGSEEAMEEVRPVRDSSTAPARPAPRP